MPNEQTQIDALKADVIEGRRKFYEKVEDVEDRLSELKTEVHGLAIRADEREARHNEHRVEIRAQIKELSDGFAKYQRETASFNRELLEAVRARGPGPSDPPSPPPVHVAAGTGKTIADHLNALDWRWTVAILFGLAILTGGVTIPASTWERWMGSTMQASPHTADAAERRPAATQEP